MEQTEIYTIYFIIYLITLTTLLIIINKWRTKYIYLEKEVDEHNVHFQNTTHFKYFEYETDCVKYAKHVKYKQNSIKFKNGTLINVDLIEEVDNSNIIQ